MRKDCVNKNEILQGKDYLSKQQPLKTQSQFLLSFNISIRSTSLRCIDNRKVVRYKSDLCPVNFTFCEYPLCTTGSWWKNFIIFRPLSSFSLLVIKRKSFIIVYTFKVINQSLYAFIIQYMHHCYHQRNQFVTLAFHDNFCRQGRISKRCS